MSSCISAGLYRPAERVLDGRASAKRGVTNNQAVSRQGEVYT